MKKNMTFLTITLFAFCIVQVAHGKIDLKKSLKKATKSVKKQVKKIAREQFSQVSHSMALENQELTKKEKIKALRELEKELLRTRVNG